MGIIQAIFLFFGSRARLRNVYSTHRWRPVLRLLAADGSPDELLFQTCRRKWDAANRLRLLIRPRVLAEQFRARGI